jgi:nicotinamide-nucleotide adenylyltransferase
MNKYKTALVVGRFQPFHKGHLYLINKTFEVADKIIIAVGSSNIKNNDNPLPYETRVAMLNKVIGHEKWTDRIIKIIPSPDDPSDDVWLKLLLENAGMFDIAIGNNSWTNGILKNAGYKVLEIPYYKRNLYQGIYIRKLFKNGGNWQERVPSYLVGFINKEFGEHLT